MLQTLTFLMTQTRLSKQLSPAHSLISRITPLLKLSEDKTPSKQTITEQVVLVGQILHLGYRGSDM